MATYILLRRLPALSRPLAPGFSRPPLPVLLRPTIPHALRRLLTTPPPGSSSEFQSRPPTPPDYKSPFQSPDTASPEHESPQREVRRIYTLTMGALAGMMALWVVARSIGGGGDVADAGDGKLWGRGRRVEVDGEKGLGVVIDEGEGGQGEVDTGTGKVKTFPVRVVVPGEVVGGDGKEEGEYVLLGHGIRTVSFLRVQVYVVGLYIHRSDLPLLRSRLLSSPTPPSAPSSPSSPTPSPLPSPSTYLHPPLRTLLRIVPVRTTDWTHLRDGFVRAILAHQPPHSPTPTNKSNDDDDFNHALTVFKSLFSPGSLSPVGLPRAVPAGRALYLLRGRAGGLRVLYDKEKEGLVGLGSASEEGVEGGVVRDERIGWALWEGYLGEGKVASEGMRGRVAEGLGGVRGGKLGWGKSGVGKVEGK